MFKKGETHSVGSHYGQPTGQGLCLRQWVSASHRPLSPHGRHAHDPSPCETLTGGSDAPGLTTQRDTEPNVPLHKPPSCSWEASGMLPAIPNQSPTQAARISYLNEG